MNNFLVLGLPRSRTAWLANFLTYDGLYCTHEGLNGFSSLAEYFDSFGDNQGDSNTGLAIFPFEDYFADFKKVIIDRDIKRAVEFSLDTYGYDSTQIMENLNSRLIGAEGLHIAYDDIDSRLDEIWDHVTNKQFDETRAELLIELNIQTHDVHRLDEAALTRLRESTLDYFPPEN